MKITAITVAGATKGSSYLVAVDGATGQCVCTCPSYRFSKTKVKICKHIRFLAVAFGATA